MASSVEFIEFLIEQLNLDTRYKKMFGEYMIYYKDKPIFLICNDTLYVKINETTTEILGENIEKGNPYNGAKEHFIVSDIDNRELLQKLAIELEKITPLPKPRTKKCK